MNTNQKNNLDMDVETRVKLNIYKTLLEEEKQKNKRTLGIGVSLFVVGIISTTTLHNTEPTVQASHKVNNNVVQTITQQGKVPRYLEKSQHPIENDFINSNVMADMDFSNVKEEDFFVSDFKM